MDGNNTGVMLGAAVLIVIAAIGGWWLGTMQVTPSQTQIQNTSSKAEDLTLAMNKLWEDHITWTRLYIVSAVNNLPDKDSTLARLMRNQEDLGNAIKTYYGNDAGNQITDLLKTHISGAGKVVEAAAKQDTDAFNSANDEWHANGQQIADFLASANPSWPQDQTRAMMKEHLDLTLQEASDIMSKKADASVQDYDKVHEQILKMSAMLSDGIVKQFPDKFK